jgi:hypothetical protein
MTASILLGTHTFAAAGHGARRQAAGVASLSALDGVEVVNVQFAEHPHHLEGLRTLAVLRGSSVGITGRQGPMKPLMSEIFDALGIEAAARGLPWFCFTNADIIFGQRAIDWILSAPGDAVVLSREDFDGDTGQAAGIELAGIDVFAVSTAWWAGHRRLFRPYLAGDGVWDNVYTAVLLCHARGVIGNRLALVRHERHSRGPMASTEFGEYTRFLSALDAPYFSLWCRYWAGLTALRASAATEERERAWAAEVFAWNPSLFDRALQAARAVKAQVRYAWWKRAHASSA